MSDVLVGIRNRYVCSEMGKKYASLTGDSNKLTMFCVSNMHYGMHVQGYDQEDIPISLDLTGIPKLRLWASRFPTISKLKILKQHCKTILPSLITSIELWTDKSASEYREELRAVVSKPQEVRISIFMNGTILICHRLLITTS